VVWSCREDKLGVNGDSNAKKGTSLTSKRCSPMVSKREELSSSKVKLRQ